MADSPAAGRGGKTDPERQRSVHAVCTGSGIRGMHNVQEAAAFLQCDGLADPFLTADMETAADYINQALDNGSRICIYGDYDCDGVTATVILYSYLLELGANVTYRIPERDEGYGLNTNAVREMHETAWN